MRVRSAPAPGTAGNTSNSGETGRAYGTRAIRAIRTVTIIGPGRLGGILAASVHRAGLRVEEVVCRPGIPALRRARIVAGPLGASVMRMPAARFSADALWLCVPDSQIAEVASEVAARLQQIRSRNSSNGSGRFPSGPIVLHSSGALSAGELEPLRALGLAAASVHPLMTFVKGSSPALKGVPFALEGDTRAVRLARQLVRQLGGAPFEIATADKPAYHAFCTFACPLLTCLLASTEKVGELAGLGPPQEMRQMLMPILRQTIANYGEMGAARGFSGPLVRGDAAVVRRHLEALQQLPAERDVYRALARAALDNLPVGDRPALARVLCAAPATQEQKPRPGRRGGRQG